MFNHWATVARLRCPSFLSSPSAVPLNVLCRLASSPLPTSRVSPTLASRRHRCLLSCLLYHSISLIIWTPNALHLTPRDLSPAGLLISIRFRLLSLSPPRTVAYTVSAVPDSTYKYPQPNPWQKPGQLVAQLFFLISVLVWPHSLALFATLLLTKPAAPFVTTKASPLVAVRITTLIYCPRLTPWRNLILGAQLGFIAFSFTFELSRGPSVCYIPALEREEDTPDGDALSSWTCCGPLGEE